ncbi:MAG: GDSL-type esterase/lipase family protein [Bacteroidota bacterium]
MNYQLFPMLLSLLILFSCGKDEEIDPVSNDPNPTTSTTNKIMPLGASRVEGARPYFESYRYELWKDLQDGGWNFDFIGTVDDETSYPVYNGQSFDDDHEGRGGWTSGQILNEINDWLSQTGAPDIVLFSSPGGNDALLNLSYDQAIANINGIIDALQAANPNVTIIIEQMAPGQTAIMTPQLTNYFNQMQQDVLTIANQQSTAVSKVITVDMYTGFTDDLLADDVHYNEAGAVFIADRYYNVLVNILEQ